MRILLVVHGFPPAASGGTEIYTHDLARALARQAVAGAPAGGGVFVLTRDADPRRPELAVRRVEGDGVTVVAINNTFQSCVSFEDSYAHPALRAVAAGVIDEVRPDIAHVQHLTCLSTGVLDELAARRIPTVMTLNDYWLICHRGQMLDRDGVSCDGRLETGCRNCIPAGMLAGPAAYRAGRLARSLPIPGASRVVRLVVKGAEAAASGSRTAGAAAARLAHMRRAAAHVQLFLAPSETLAAEFRRFGLAPDRLRRCHQGIDAEPFARAVRSPSPVLRVGFAGGLIPSKAPHVLLQAIATLPGGTVTVDLLGSAGAYHGSSEYAETVAPLLRHPAIRRLGPVPHERMPAALAGVDVVVMPSVWRENAPFTIREAFAARAPVVASDLGGMAEMVRHDVDGLLFPPGDANALAGHLRRLARDRGLLERLRAGIVPPLSIDEDAGALLKLYGELATPRAERPRRPATRSGAPDMAAIVLNYRTPDETRLAVRSLQTSRVVPPRIVVVDNGAENGSSDLLRRSLASADVISSAANLGFSGGCNLGIRDALARGAEYVLLVNSDAVLAPAAMGHLLDAVRDRPDLGIVAPVLLSREEPDRMASAGISFSLTSGRMRHRGAGLPVSLLPPGEIHDVDAVSGCVMLVRRAVFERAGLLDEAYFFSFEDIDFCLRARGHGFKTAVVQQAFVYHHGARTIGRRSPRRVYFATRNHLRLARLAGRPEGRRLRTGLVIGLNAAYVLVAPDAPLAGGIAAVVRGAVDYWRGKYGPD